MTFAEQMQAARIAAGLSQSQAALAIGRSPSTLRKWEQAVNTPHAQIQQLVLAALTNKLDTFPPKLVKLGNPGDII